MPQCKFNDEDCECMDVPSGECLYHEFFIGVCECFGEELEIEDGSERREEMEEWWRKMKEAEEKGGLP